MVSRIFSTKPNRQLLSQAFGFRVPQDFVTLVLELYEITNDDLIKADEILYSSIGYTLGGAEARYSRTPPELFPIGRMGVDGVHLGYVIYAPELEPDDYPLGQFCPMDDDGVIYVGGSTSEGIENLMSWGMANSVEDSVAGAFVERVVLELGIHPAEEHAMRMFGPDGNGRRIRPRIPLGWRHVPSSDGVGVLAPGKWFSPCEKIFTGRKYPEERYLYAARRSMKAGYPASALLYLREMFWNFGMVGITDLRILTIYLQDAYLALGRDRLAEIVEKRLQNSINGISRLNNT